VFFFYYFCLSIHTIFILLVFGANEQNCVYFFLSCQLWMVQYYIYMNDKTKEFSFAWSGTCVIIGCVFFTSEFATRVFIYVTRKFYTTSICNFNVALCWCRRITKKRKFYCVTGRDFIFIGPGRATKTVAEKVFFLFCYRWIWVSVSSGYTAHCWNTICMHHTSYRNVRFWNQ
jgi:hypothetical protein